MKYAADFRSLARNALSGKWGKAVIACLIASLLGAIATGGPEITFSHGEQGLNVDLEMAGQQVYTFGTGWTDTLTGILAGTVMVILLLALVVGVAYFIVGSVVGIGYYRFNLDLVDRRTEPQVNTLVGYFPHWKTAAAAKLLQGLYVFLWALLFIIPGIMAGYSYAMTGYILAENPEMTATEAIEQSKHMMYGNRWRLFCLQLSFLGWDLLCVFTLGIGNLWLTPYKQAAEAAFYRDISATEYILDSAQ